MFKENYINNKRVFISDLIPDLTHLFTTRDSFIKTKDENCFKQVVLNKKDICNYLGISEQNLISPKQIHSTNIEVAVEGKTEYPDTDAIILTNKEQAVFLNFADCTPIILFDKENNIAALVHAGWRGTAQSIVQKTLKIMFDKYNSKPLNIYAVIGPAISKCCYEVGKDVFEQLETTVSDVNGLYEKNENNKFYVDLKGLNKKQLNEVGVYQIDICPYCTGCNNDLFFSYRKENGTTNRHNAIIKLK